MYLYQIITLCTLKLYNVNSNKAEKIKTSLFPLIKEKKLKENYVEIVKKTIMGQKWVHFHFSPLYCLFLITAGMHSSMTQTTFTNGDSYALKSGKELNNKMCDTKIIDEVR